MLTEISAVWHLLTDFDSGLYWPVSLFLSQANSLHSDAAAISDHLLEICQTLWCKHPRGVESWAWQALLYKGCANNEFVQILLKRRCDTGSRYWLSLSLTGCAHKVLGLCWPDPWKSTLYSQNICRHRDVGDILGHAGAWNDASLTSAPTWRASMAITKTCNPALSNVIVKLSMRPILVVWVRERMFC